MWTNNMSFALIIAALVTIIGWCRKRISEHRKRLDNVVYPFNREYFEMYCSLIRHVETLKSCEE